MKLKKVLLSCVLAASCALGLTGCKEKVPAGNISEEVTFKDGDKIAEINIEGYGTIRAKLFPDIAPKAVENFEKLVKVGYYDGLTIHRVAKDMCIQGGSLNGDGTGGSALVDESGIFPIETSPDARNFYGALGYAASAEGDNTTQFYIVNSKKTDDITKYSPDLIRSKANAIAEQKEGLEEGDPVLTKLTYDETALNNLADMIKSASEDVVTRYAEKGGYPLWDGAFTVFGQVYEGFEVLDKLSSVEVMTGRDGKLDKPKTEIIIESVKITEYKEPEPEPESTPSSKKKK